jgi:hypothetical protein
LLFDRFEHGLGNRNVLPGRALLSFGHRQLKVHLAYVEPSWDRHAVN